MGTGTMLMLAAQNMAASKGEKSCCVYVAPESRAVAFYRKLGYEQAGPRVKEIMRLDRGGNIDITYLRMTRKLSL